MYVLLAQSLLQGQYRELGVAGTPLATHFPPGFPALLAIAVPFVQADWNVLKIIPLSLALLNILLFAVLVRAWLATPYAFASLILFAWNPHMLFWSDLLISEWWLQTLILILFLLFLKSKEKGPQHTWTRVAFVLCLSWASLTRFEGLLLSVAIGITLLSEKRLSRQWLLILMAPVTAHLLWLGRNAFFTGTPGTNFGAWVMPSLEMLFQSLRMTVQALFYFRSAPSGILSILLEGTIACLLIMALVRDLRTPAPLWRKCLAVYVLLFVFLHMMWPMKDFRFFLPILPFLVCYLVHSLYAIASHDRLPRAASSVFIGILLTILAWHQWGRDNLWAVQPFDRLPHNTFAFIKDQTPPDTIFISNKDPYLYLQRQNAARVLADTPEEFAYALVVSSVSYAWILKQPIGLLSARKTWVTWDAWLREWGAAFPIVYENPEERSTVFRVALSTSYARAYEEYLRARQFEGFENRKKMLLALQSVVKKFPGFPAAWSDIGALHLEMKNAPAALVALTRALALRPQDPLFMLNLARTYRALHEEEKAHVWIEKAAQAAQAPHHQDLLELISAERAR
jgi:hypothetical protein